MCHSSRCMICDGPVAGSRWVCMDCAARWALGPSVVTWPEWARALKQFEQQRRRIEEAEPSMVSLDPNGNAPKVNSESHDALLDYAPYDDEASNRAYRQSCGIAEREDAAQA